MCLYNTAKFMLASILNDHNNEFDKGDLMKPNSLHDVQQKLKNK